MQYNIKDKDAINNAIEKILKGEIIIYPTDTLYGFGVDATNTSAVEKLNEVKNRKQPYSIIVDSINMLKKYCNINSEQENYINNILPGPFTFILNQKNNNLLSELVTIGLDTVGIRIPKSKFIIEIIKKINKPIITTSVNSHGKAPLNSIELIASQYYMFDIYFSKKVYNSKGSTIIDLTFNPYKILRQGDGKVRL